jgi:hypothetical protein
MCWVRSSCPRGWPARARGLIDGSLRLIPSPIKGPFDRGIRHIGDAICKVGARGDRGTRRETLCS